jgi:signal peptidase I
MMIFKWLFSKAVREAGAVKKHYARLLTAQRDILPPQAVGAVQLKLDELSATIKEGHKGRMNIKAEELQFAAEKWLKPYPNAAWRENVEVLLVALAVAMGIRTFFVQPFKIPTGSMQPTLYGVTSVPDFTKVNFWQVNKAKLQADVREQINLRDAIQVPTGWERVKDWFAGNSYVHVVAQADGMIEKISPMNRFLIFNLSQTFSIGGVEQTMWFPPDYGEADLVHRAGLDPAHVYHKGDDIVKMMRVSTGDHLFVDRLTFNFRKPERGEIIVFETKGIQGLPQDQFYIKRMVVKPGERVQIGNDRHLLINGQRLDASTPHFENVYGFNPNKPPHESEYSGHVNGTVASTYGLYPNLAPNFPDAETVFNNPDDSYMVMGDNTCNSSDSRTWGSFPAKNVIGKSFFVYWPITKRFGWGNQ